MIDSHLLELIMVVENEFDISIEDEEAIAAITTPRELAGYVYQQLQKSIYGIVSKSNSTQRKFQYLRCELSKNFHIPLPQIFIDTPIKKIISNGNIKKNWQTLSTLCDNSRRFPKLRLPYWGYAFFACLNLLIAAIMYLGGYAPQSILLSMLTFSVISFTLAYVFLRTRIPPQITNVASLLPFIQDSEKSQQSEPHILIRLMALVSEVFHIPSEKITPDSHFVYDLHLE